MINNNEDDETKHIIKSYISNPFIEIINELIGTLNKVMNKREKYKKRIIYSLLANILIKQKQIINIVIKLERNLQFLLQKFIIEFLFIKACSLRIIVNKLIAEKEIVIM